MKRIFTLLAVVAFGVCSVGSAIADPPKQCRDVSGKFIKCPPPAPPVTVRCRDKTTKKFVKCGSPNSEPVPNTGTTTTTTKPPG